MVEFEHINHPTHTIIALKGEVDLYGVGDLKKELMKYIEENKDSINSLAIDMSQLKYMDSSGIALMANLQKKVKAQGGKFYLLAVNEDIMNVLRLSALDSFFNIHESADALP
ncbi:MAG: STAS domain-containing protein [Leptospiraceae bacterium]|nr:STAS domain-containing protein [Leptospiraceae bacterium]MCB1315899.1 STAS domain-containing protein [Leptospiraceae bacterium]